MKRPDLVPTDIQGLLAHAQEECAELQLALAKCARFGFEATDPQTGRRYNNLNDAQNELADVTGAYSRLRAAVHAEWIRANVSDREPGEESDNEMARRIARECGDWEA